MTASPPPPPEAPVDLMAVTEGCHVMLAWTECGASGIGFRIERTDDPGPDSQFSEIGVTGMNVAVFRDDSVMACSADYSYRVCAWNASGDSPPSNVVEVTISQAGTELTGDQE